MQVGSIDVDNNSRSALGNSKAAASAPTAGVNASGRRHLAQVHLITCYQPCNMSGA